MLLLGIVNSRKRRLLKTWTSYSKSSRRMENQICSRVGAISYCRMQEILRRMENQWMCSDRRDDGPSFLTKDCCWQDIEEVLLPGNASGMIFGVGGCAAAGARVWRWLVTVVSFAAQNEAKMQGNLHRFSADITGIETIPIPPPPPPPVISLSLLLGALM